MFLGGMGLWQYSWPKIGGGLNPELCGPLLWPDEPTEDYVKTIILSPRFRVGLLVWFIRDDEMWKKLTDELGGSFPVEWMVRSKPNRLNYDILRLGVLKAFFGDINTVTVPPEKDEPGLYDENAQLDEDA
jgi:hypothetical protein